MENDPPNVLQPPEVNNPPLLRRIDEYIAKQRTLRMERGAMKEHFVLELVSQTRMRAGIASNIFETLMRRRRAQPDINAMRPASTLAHFDRKVTAHKLRALYAIAYEKSLRDDMLSMRPGTMCICPAPDNSDCEPNPECMRCVFKHHGMPVSVVEQPCGKAD